MQIIIISIPWFSPAYKAGGPVQSISNLVGQFSDGVTYKIVTSNTDLDGSVLQVPADKWVPYNNNTFIYYASGNSNLTSVLKSSIKNFQPSIVYITGIYSWSFNLIPLLLGGAHKIIVSVRGMLHPGALSQKEIKKKLYLIFWKFLRLHKKCNFHASDEQEKKYIQNIFGNQIRINVAQNFPRIFKVTAPPEKKTGFLNLVSIALVSPMKNHLLVLKALMHSPFNITYNIYGPIKDKIYWNLCLEQIKLLPNNIMIKYHGDISPDQVEGAIGKCHVFILPSKSENFGHAISEALSAGRPTITSNNTPWNHLRNSYAGINVDPEDIKSLSESIDYFAIMDEVDYSQWILGAKAFSNNAININEIKEQYNNMFFN